MSEELAEIIREEIRRDGPIPFSRWMELCLYHPQYGYYMKPGRKTGYGRDADFVTPPTLHPFFAQCVAMEIRDAWHGAGRPDRFAVAEFGGGEGTLAKAAADHLARAEPLLAKAMRWLHVETSPSHRAAIEGHHAGAFTTTRDLGMSGCDVTVACEFLDALPTNVFEMTSNGWRQLHVGLGGDMFAAVWKIAAPTYCCSPGTFPTGATIAQSAMLDSWLMGALASTRRTILLVDYGGAGPRRGGKIVDGTPRGFRKHDHVEVTDAPGTADITVNVDFGEIEHEAEEWSDFRGSLESLEQFLLRHGILEELNKIDRNTVEGASSYLRLRQLLLPSGMGTAFKVQRFDRAPTPAAPSAEA